MLQQLLSDIESQQAQADRMRQHQLFSTASITLPEIQLWSEIGQLHQLATERHEALVEAATQEAEYRSKVTELQSKVDQAQEQLSQTQVTAIDLPSLKQQMVEHNVGVTMCIPLYSLNDLDT